MIPLNHRFRQFAPYVLAALTIAVLVIRRPDQFRHPYMWVEEGAYILPHYIRYGWWSITEPISGYHILATKLIAFPAYKLSVLWAPAIEQVLTVALTCAVTAAVAFSPTSLRWPFLCACATLVIPTDPENYAIASYANWWAGILVFLAALWNTRRWEGLRYFYIVLGGLSSPIIIVADIILFIRAALDRTRQDITAAVVALLVTGVQGYAFYVIYQLKAHYTADPVRSALLAVEEFVGRFLYTDAGPALGFVLAAALVAVAWRVRNRLDRSFILLFLMFGGAVATVSLRMPVEDFATLHPVIVAPRYFFYPFILLGWVMIWLASLAQTPVRVGIAAVFVISIAQIGPAFIRHQDGMNWRKNVRACASAQGPYSLPIQYSGKANEAWHAEVTGDECREMLRQSLFDKL